MSPVRQQPLQSHDHGGCATYEQWVKRKARHVLPWHALLHAAGAGLVGGDGGGARGDAPPAKHELPTASSTLCS